MERLQWTSAQHFEKLWGTQTGRSSLVRAFKEEVEKCYGAKSATVTHYWCAVHALCYVHSFGRVDVDAAVGLFSWDYVEKVAGLMQEVTMPACSGQWVGLLQGIFFSLVSGLPLYLAWHKTVTISL